MNQLRIIKLKYAIHNEKEVVQILFTKNDEVTQLLRTRTQMRWSKTMNCWHLPYCKTITQDLFGLFKNKIHLDYSELKTHIVLEKESLIQPQTQQIIKPVEELQVLSAEVVKKMEEFKYWLLSKRYSESTIGTYTEALKIFLRYYSHKLVSDITNDDLISFNNHYIIANHFSASYQNQVVNSVKLFFRTVENKH